MTTSRYNNNSFTIIGFEYINTDVTECEDLYTNNLKTNDILITPISKTQILNNQIVQTSSFINQMDKFIMNLLSYLDISNCSGIKTINSIILTSIELSDIDGVSSNIQNQINSLVTTISSTILTT